MALKATLCVIVHHVSHTKPDLTARPRFRILNSHTQTVCFPRFAVSISVAMHLVKAHKS